VVDDAIVMIENITRYIEAGDALEAALKGSAQSALHRLLTRLLIAVLIPLLFMSDSWAACFANLRYAERDILASAVVSLTLLR